MALRGEAKKTQFRDKQMIRNLTGKLLLYGKAAFAEDGFSLVKNHVILLVAFVNTVDSLVKDHIIKSVYK